MLNNETLNEVQKLIDNNEDKKFIEVNFLRNLKIESKNTIYNDIEFVKDSIKNVQSINPNPDKVRNYVSRDNSPIFADASNLSAVLDRLISNYNSLKRRIERHKELDASGNNGYFNSINERYEEQKKKYDMLLSIVKLLPEYEIKELSTIITPSPLRDVMLTCVEVHNGNDVKMPASLLSDGTIKVIAIATALVTNPENSVLLLDEFDSGTHQTKSFELLTKLFEVAKKRNITLVVTTHNTSLLNQYTVEYLEGTSIVFRTKDSGNSEIINFYDLNEVEKLLARGGLGDASLKDGLNEYLYTTKETNKASLPEWLQNMGEGGYNG
ncbi:AAA family ATPase [Lactococcus lactis]|nr:AAA family ATPase [Lactococcus lactis]